jgi:hypothetical protein
LAGSASRTKASSLGGVIVIVVWANASRAAPAQHTAAAMLKVHVRLIRRFEFTILPSQRIAL